MVSFLDGYSLLGITNIKIIPLYILYRVYIIRSYRSFFIPMNITGVSAKGWYKYLHQAIYGALDNTPLFREGLYDENGAINSSISEQLPPYHSKAARRVHLINWRYQAFLNSRPDPELPNEQVETALPELRRCPPAGVFTDDKRKKMYCRRYAVCPWCRFRKALEIAAGLEPYLSQTRQLAYLTLVTPMNLLIRDSMEEFFVDQPFHDDYRKLINSLCKKQRPFIADYVLTIPDSRATFEEQGSMSSGEPRDFSFNLSTTIIGIMEKDTQLPLPENCISNEVRSRAVFHGAGAGTWIVGKATKKMLARALGAAMGFSPALLSTRLNREDYAFVINLQAHLRAVGHKAPGDRR